LAIQGGLNANRNFRRRTIHPANWHHRTVKGDGDLTASRRIIPGGRFWRNPQDFQWLRGWGCFLRQHRLNQQQNR
jgi:hypothetical protein